MGRIDIGKNVKGRIDIGLNVMGPNDIGYGNKLTGCISM